MEIKDPADIVAHSGVMGMHWGVRNSHSSSTDSSDHKVYAQARKKKMKDMSDPEIKAVVKRAKLLNEFKKTQFPRPTKGHMLMKTSQLSNSELELHIKKAKLYKSGGKYGFTKMSEVYKMPHDQVNKAMKRANLEKSYKDIKKEEIRVTAVVKFMLSGLN